MLLHTALLAHLLTIQYQNTKVKNGMRVTRVELPAGAGAGEMALHIPISLQAAGETSVLLLLGVMVVFCMHHPFSVVGM